MLLTNPSRIVLNSAAHLTSLKKPLAYLSGHNIARFGISSSSNRMMTTTSSAKASLSGKLTSGQSEPQFIYGTAWKKDKTKELVKDALRNGFRHVDTAAQPKHYQEKAVGEGIRDGLKEVGLPRKSIYIQTKYTSPNGQDSNNMPYNASDPLENQVRTSVASSLKNLRPVEDSEHGSYLDCLLLHSPLPTIQQTLAAWHVLESYVPDKVRTLGISNVTLPVLEAIYEASTIKPSVVQNRFYPQTYYDVSLRAYCREKGIQYQSFWTLTGNPNLLKSEPVVSLAKATDVGSATALYALVMDLGIVVLNGTTSAQHMRDDISGMRKIRHWAVANEHDWTNMRDAFQRIVEGL